MICPVCQEIQIDLDNLNIHLDSHFVERKDSKLLSKSVAYLAPSPSDEALLQSRIAKEHWSTLESCRVCEKQINTLLQPRINCMKIILFGNLF